MCDGGVEARQRLGLDPDVLRAFGTTPDSPTPRPMSRAEATVWLAEESADDGRMAWIVKVLAGQDRASRSYVAAGFLRGGLEREVTSSTASGRTPS